MREKDECAQTPRDRSNSEMSPAPTRATDSVPAGEVDDRSWLGTPTGPTTTKVNLVSDAIVHVEAVRERLFLTRHDQRRAGQWFAQRLDDRLRVIT